MFFRNDTAMNKIDYRCRVHLFRVLCWFALMLTVALPSVAQSEAAKEAMARAQERQAKMMETQMFMQQLMQLGFNGELRKELEVVDDQVESVKELAENYQRDMMEFHRDNGQIGIEIQKLMKEGKNEEAGKLGEEYQNRMKDFSASYMDQAAEVLLPHQISRLKQIAKRQGAKYSNEFQDEFGIAATVADEIGLSAEEKKRLTDAIKEAREEYYAIVEEAKKKANEKILATLTTEQQEKMKEILGEEYDQQAMQRKSRAEMMKKQRERMKKQREMMEKRGAK